MRQRSDLPKPFPSECTFDGVFADNVLEHLGEPTAAFMEVRRVLKPRGWFICKTPNKYHYVALAARLTPHRFHQVFNSWRGRARTDTFPTLYRANSRSAIIRLAQRVGLAVEKVDYLEGRPEYLRLHFVPYMAGLLYERLVNATDWFERLRVLLIATMRRPS